MAGASERVAFLTVAVVCPVCRGQRCAICGQLGVIDAEPAEGVILPAAVTVRCGNLELTGPEAGGGRCAIPAHTCRLRIEGQPLAFRRVVIEAECGKIVRATVELFPREAGTRPPAGASAPAEDEPAAVVAMREGGRQ